MPADMMGMNQQPPMGGVQPPAGDTGKDAMDTSQDTVGEVKPIPDAPISDETGLKDDSENTSEGNDSSKKEIQKLAGKLSQLLKDYNDEHGTDEELNKYVKGMIDAQTEEDYDAEADDDDDADNDENESMPNDGENDEMSDETPEDMPQPQSEGRIWTKSNIQEMFNQLGIESPDSKKDKAKSIKAAKGTKNNPFNPPTFQ